MSVGFIALDVAKTPNPQLRCNLFHFENCLDEVRTGGQSGEVCARPEVNMIGSLFDLQPKLEVRQT